MLDTFSANIEIPKRRSWESSKIVLSSQPEEDEPVGMPKDNEFSPYASVWQSGAGLKLSESSAGEPAVGAAQGQEKVKEGFRLVRKLKQFRKGTLFLFVHTVYIEILYMYYPKEYCITNFSVLYSTLFCIRCVILQIASRD
jgi:hypothetical protein